MRRTIFVAVIATIYLFALHGVEMALFYFSGATFMSLLVITLGYTFYNFFTKGNKVFGFFFLALHGLILLSMMPFLMTLTKGLGEEHRVGKMIALLVGLNTFFIIVLLRALGEQLIEKLNRSQSPTS